MALTNHNANLKFLKIKEGKFVLGEESYNQLEGLITKMYYKDDDYKGTALRKLVVVISDETGNYALNLDTNYSSYSTLVSFLKNADITKPLSLHPKETITVKDGKEISRTSLMVSQNDVFCKSYFTKDNKHGLPEWNMVKIGGKKITDKTDYLEFLEKFVQTNYISKLENIVKPTKKVPVPIEEAEVEEVDSFPWDK